jgi:hypothetical protein
VAGNSKETVANSGQFSKHFSPMTTTFFGTVIERRCLQPEKARAARFRKRELQGLKLSFSSKTAIGDD